MMVWQSPEQNELDIAIHRSLEGADASTVAPEGPDPSRSPTARPCKGSWTRPLSPT